jgi:hypothetical protein
MAFKTVLPDALVNEANALLIKSRAVLDCLGDGIAHLDSPEKVVPGLTWLLTDQLTRIEEIINSKQEA